MQEHKTTLALAGAPAADGSRFEVLAISAGSGNGWEFGEECLRASLALWDGAACFVDHALWGHSVRDLCGAFSQPVWDEREKGIRLTLRPVGPSGPILAELGRQILGGAEGDERAQGVQPKVGFSADLTFTANGKRVERILKIYSVDLVIDPARGGAFLRALNQLGFAERAPGGRDSQNPSSIRKERFMPEETPVSSPLKAELEAERAAVREILTETERVRQEAEAARAVRAEMCAQLLDAALSNARLPAAVTARIRKQFAGRVFEPSELTGAIDDARAMVSEITGGLTVQGPGRVSAMFSSEDQLQAAVDDLLGAPRSEGHEKLAVSHLSGIRELYLLLTGDHDLHGGYHASRIGLATTADFTGLVKNALNKIVVNQWGELGRAGYDWWSRIATVQHFNTLQTVTGTLVGTVGALPEVAEGAAYTELAIGDSPETAAWKKYGGYIPLTLELIDRDETHKLKAYPRELAAAGLRKISALVAAIFTANAGVGPTLADTGALFNNTAVTTAGGHANLLTTALSAAEWEVVSKAVYNQPLLIKNAAGLYGSGPAMAISPRFCLVPRALQLTAMKILYPTLENAANIYSENLQRGQPGDVVTVPEWTDATDWAAVCDPRIAPAIYVGERFGLIPQIFMQGDETQGAVFTNDEHRLKVRHFLAVWVNDFRPLHKSNVSG